VSGVTVPTNQIAIVPKPSSSKIVSVERMTVNGEYLIWNSWGNVRYAKAPEGLGAFGGPGPGSPTLSSLPSLSSTPHTPTQDSDSDEA